MDHDITEVSTWNMVSVKFDYENRDSMKFHMGQLDVPKGYVKPNLETSVYLISHYASKGWWVKHHSENKRQAKSHSVPGGTHKKILLKERVCKFHSETKQCTKFHPEAKWWMKLDSDNKKFIKVCSENKGFVKV